MASENNKWLQRVLGPAAKLRGFKKSGATWRKEAVDAIGVLNLQGSQWGPSFYINLGVYFRALGDHDQPSEYHCHVRTRLSELVPDRERLNTLLNFERPVEDNVRARELEALVLKYGLPWLDTVSTVEGAREYCCSLVSKSPWVTKEARAFLESAHGA
ncbi:MAG: DUF4304 domain-containing protein [Planctomycetes bacterium]|nr:DUF4304 domain-containing protein [Planctomycetota bacterium]